ncbi:uncharacterized protein LOC121235369 [Juglans microcarpa x Juglans regia]|uniref:uncharacterized protein LOC121235369 n=1 Tax=Juglans microcarpa x Juglans regia TaxID=2249226 RepID=UPI001B7EED1D|nr:uncharacterized protein LOC121235369 [Juglans microcarpa x Juglans regia]
MVKLFLWKATNELLPTKKNLFQRKVVEDPFYPVCLKEEESVIHVLWECPAANDVWKNGLIGVSKWKMEGGDFLGLWERLMGGLDKFKLEEKAVHLRKVWLRRNILVFEKRLTCPKTLISTSIETLEAFKQANKGMNNEVQQSVVPVNKTRWIRPAANLLR